MDAAQEKRTTNPEGWRTLLPRNPGRPSSADTAGPSRPSALPASSPNSAGLYASEARRRATFARYTGGAILGSEGSGRYPPDAPKTWHPINLSIQSEHR